MTEDDWLECDDPKPMLDLLRGKTSDRKLRLFACACCRRIWHLLPDERSQRAVEIAEGYSDEQSSQEEREYAHKKAQYAVRSARDRKADMSLIWAAKAATTVTTRTTFAEAASEAALAVESDKAVATKDEWVPGAFQGIFGPKGRVYAAWVEEQRQQCIILRDIFGNPFRPTAINPNWLSWKDGTLVRMADEIYSECCFDRLPDLASALQKAGCKEESFLAHCRNDDPHVRGCWVVDSLLGKE